MSGKKVGFLRKFKTKGKYRPLKLLIMLFCFSMVTILLMVFCHWLFTLGWFGALVSIALGVSCVFFLALVFFDLFDRLIWGEL